MEPSRPKHPPEYAQVCLQALANHGLGNKISLGGAFGLMHYFEYRRTYDVDAWWQSETTSKEQQEVVAVLKKTLLDFGSVKTRTWGDVVSIELRSDDRQVFSFQIAGRSAQLEPAIPSPWQGILLDSFDDLLASKMVALVERGAPRDFLDIYSICDNALATPQGCWQLWRRRQELASSDPNPERAQLAVLSHMSRIEQHRPLENIVDDNDRAEAERVRKWFKEVFVNVLA